MVKKEVRSQNSGVRIQNLCGLCVKIFLLALCLYAFVPLFAADTSTALKWFVDTDRPAKQNWQLRRGETVVFEPTFRTYQEIMNLADAHTCVLRYKSSDMTNSYCVVTGAVYSATGGVCRIRWTAANEPTNSSVAYDIVVSGSSGTVVRAWGDLSFTASIADSGSTNTRPREFSVIDFATCDLQNVGLAPFISSYDISDLQNFDASLLNGTANLDINNLTVRGTLTGSAANMTNFPDGIVQSIINGGTTGTTGQISRVGSAYTIIFPLGGGGGGGGVSYLTNLLDVVISSPLEGDTISYNGTNWINKAAGESLTTNRLTWVVGGQTIGYVDTNGITMLKGSLQLFEEDLNCNVRAYDGSKNAPSVSFYASPLVGWYRKSYAGNYAWAFAHTSNDIFYVHYQGITMAGTNKMTSYYFNTSGAYQFNGTNGGTTNITVVTSVLTNGSGSVTGLVSQVLHFRGGLFFNE